MYIWKAPLLLGDWERVPEPHGRTGKLFSFELERGMAGVAWRKTEVEETHSSYAMMFEKQGPAQAVLKVKEWDLCMLPKTLSIVK